jgi:colanic acid/amylovoran biosynthesis protein
MIVGQASRKNRAKTSMRQPFKVLIVHAYTHKNKGDCCIVQAMVNGIRRQMPNVWVAVSSVDASDKGCYGEDAWIPGIAIGSLQERSLFARRGKAISSVARAMLATMFYKMAGYSRNSFVDACGKVDAVIACGGGYLYDKGACALLLSLASFYIPIFLDKPLALAAQSIGPFQTTTWQTRLLRRLLKHSMVRRIHVREDISQLLMQEWGLKSKTDLVPDMAFSLINPQSFRSRLARVDRGRLSSALGFTVRRWFRDPRQQDDYEQKIVDVLNRCGVACDRLVPFVQVDAPEFNDSDRETTQRVIERLSPGIRDKCEYCCPSNPVEMLSELTKLQVFLGVRMHSNILALLADVPVVAIGYQYKTQGIMNMIGLSNYVFGIEDFDVGRVADLIMRLMKFGEDYPDQVSVELQRLGQTASDRLREVLDDLRLFDRDQKESD